MLWLCRDKVVHMMCKDWCKDILIYYSKSAKTYFSMNLMNVHRHSGLEHNSITQCTSSPWVYITQSCHTPTILFFSRCLTWSTLEQPATPHWLILSYALSRSLFSSLSLQELVAESEREVKNLRQCAREISECLFFHSSPKPKMGRLQILLPYQTN